MFNLYLLVGTIIWLYILSVLKRSHLNAFYFWIGSFGAFIIISFLSKMYFVWLMSRIIAVIMKLLSYIFSYYHVDLSYNLILMKLNNINIQLFINYECSGAIETFAFESLLIFFPIYTSVEKTSLMIIGALWIMVANIIRLLFVITTIQLGGIDHLFFVHSVVGRLLFYIVIIALYYTVFTKAQIIHGWKHNLREDSII